MSDLAQIEEQPTNGIREKTNQPTKTKTKKRKYKSINKAALWNIFEQEVLDKAATNVPVECIYGAKNRDFCDSCNTILVYSEEGFLTCTNRNCGIVYKDLVDQSAEWRYYGADDNHAADPTRCGMPINPLLEESSYGCKVLCAGPMSYEMRKIRRYTEWQSMPHKEKTQYDEFQIITSMAHNAGIPKMIIDDAIVYHKKISESSASFRGDNRDGIIAASIYISCRINNYPRTAKEIATIFHLDPASATKGCKNALSIINILEQDMDSSEKTQFANTKPVAFIERFCSKLNMNEELTKLCKFISLKIEQQDYMAENAPQSTAAGAVYFVVQSCRLNISKWDIFMVSGVSEVTVNKCCKKIEKLHLKTPLLPEAIIRKYCI